jgi:hypothetical protein
VVVGVALTGGEVGVEVDAGGVELTVADGLTDGWAVAEGGVDIANVEEEVTFAGVLAGAVAVLDEVV